MRRVFSERYSLHGHERRPARAPAGRRAALRAVSAGAVDVCDPCAARRCTRVAERWAARRRCSTRRRLPQVGGADREALAVVRARRLDQPGVLGEHPVDPLEHGGVVRVRVARASASVRRRGRDPVGVRRRAPSAGSRPPTRNALVALASAFTRLVRMVWMRTSCAALLRASSMVASGSPTARRSRARRTRGWRRSRAPPSTRMRPGVPDTASRAAPAPGWAAAGRRPRVVSAAACSRARPWAGAEAEAAAWSRSWS